MKHGAAMSECQQPDFAGPVLPQASRLAAAAAAAAWGVDFAQIYAASRCRRPVARARQAAIYLAHVGFGLSYATAAREFGRDRATVRHACAVIENTRDDHGRDLALAWLEAALHRYVRYCDSLAASVPA